VISKEESNFFSTIDGGLERIDRVFREMAKTGRVMVSGDEAADMYTTHGFPPELFETLAAERNFTFDWSGYRAAMERHGVESGGGQKIELFQSSPLDALKKAMHGSEFLGYEAVESTARVVGLIAQDKLCDQINEVGHAQPVVVVLDRTPFYGESGGQVGDTGTLVAEGVRFDVINTLREGGFILHIGHLRSGILRQGASVTARVDAERRAGILRAHSATHMLHHALRTHLEGRSRLVALRFSESASAIARRSSHDRGRGERPRGLGRSGRVDDNADCRRAEAGGYDALRREVPRRRPRRLDGGFQ
jgi:alanyl-tRNA synthetase